MGNLICVSIEFDESKIKRIGKTIEDEILKSTKLKSSEKEMLFAYPVVYVHTWRNSGKLKVYVGETIDIIRRSEEHINVGEDSNSFDYKWQKNWMDENSTERLSFFFTGKEMNKSLSLNIEDSLIRIMGQVECVTDCNSRTNDQSNNFSNKYLTDSLVLEIWNRLKEQVIDLPEKYEKDINKTSNAKLEADKCTSEFVSLRLKEKINSKDEHIKKIREKIAEEKKDILLNYPVVYFYIWKNKQQDRWHSYVGEANNLVKRTVEHWDYININKDEDWHDSWKEALKSGNATMFVWSGNVFNKSVTLDLENRIMIYMTAQQDLIIENGRTNAQRKYVNKGETYILLKNIVNVLCKEAVGFKQLSKVGEEAPYLASSLLELNCNQEKAVESIKNAVFKHWDNISEKKKLIIIHGGAGTGKTVVLSKSFFDIMSDSERKITPKFVVNRQELFNVYMEQCNRWQVSNDDDKEQWVYKAESLINTNDITKDVVFVDEGHLLFSKAGEGKNIKGNQLLALVKNARITVLVFDFEQFVESDKYWGDNWKLDDKEDDRLKENFRKQIGISEDELEIQILHLEEQLRMTCADETYNWISDFYRPNLDNKYMIRKLGGTFFDKKSVDKKTTLIARKDSKDYYVGVVDTFDTLIDVINTLKKNDKPAALVATYDWTTCNGYVLNRIPWHKKENGEKIHEHKAFWTFDDECKEVGSIHDIQGFDLNYVGVILGPSITWDEQKGLIYSKHKGRGMKSEDVQILYPNEVGVLLTRGRKGLIIYACNKELRKKLKECLKKDDKKR